MATRSNSRDFNSVKRSRSTHYANISKLYKELEQKLTSLDNYETVKLLYTQLCDKYETFESVHQDCLSVCTDPDMRADLENTFDSCQKNYDEFKERVSQWMIAGKKIADDADDVHSSISSTSSRNKLRGAKAKRLIAEHKLKALREKQKLEQERREIEFKSQLIDQESAVEEARIEESILEEEMEEDRISHVPDAAARVTVSRGEDRRISDDEQRQERVPEVHTRGLAGTRDVTGRQQATSDVMSGNKDTFHVDSAFHKLASTLQEGFNLPKPELLTFTGKSIDYSKFIKNFETNVESKVSDDRLRLSYLIQYCTGEARTCIDDCVLLEPREGYRRARSILQSRYGKPHVIARAFIDRLISGPQLKASDSEGLSQLALEMQKCEITLSQLGFVSDVDNSENLRRIVRRLPMHLRTRWVDVAHDIIETGREPRFSDLVRFVDRKSQVACSMYGADLAKDSFQSKADKINFKQNDFFKGKVTTLATNTDSKKLTYERKCVCCSGSCSDLASCKMFRSMSLGNRRKLVREAKLCFNCLKGNHFSSTCRKTKLCTVTDCSQKHHTLLHYWVRPEFEHPVTQPSVNCVSTSGSFVKTCLGIIPVTVKGANGNSCQTYALLDDGADKTLCDERLLNTLNIPGRHVTFQISTINATGSAVSGQEVDLQVKPIRGNGEVSLKNVWSVKSLPISKRSAASDEDINKFPHLTGLNIPSVEAGDVMLLIGTDVPNAHIPLEVRTGGSNQPYAVRTRLGWAVRGPIVDGTDEKTGSEVNIHFGQSRDMILQEQLEQMWKTDFNDAIHSDKESFSVEDKRALQIMDTTISHEDGHYKIGLPWRDENVVLPNNIALAHVRLQHLSKRLSRDTELHEKYTATMTDYIEKGYATEVKAADDADRTWYLPHHPVTNEHKPGKVRVVFDCASKFKGISLNSQLLQGPDMVNSLVGVLCRFRQEKVAMVADIEAMFHQVRMSQNDCNALRFLWWPGGDMSLKPKTYCMQVHLFGATSSPSCAAYALKRTVADNADRFEPDVISSVHRNFYVDDCLKSVSSEEKAIQLAHDLKSLLSLGGFRLTKWLSNSRTVLEAIPEMERAKSVIRLEPSDSLPTERALGVTWNVNDDTIRFEIKLAEKPFTRRGILSIVSSIFDPLGLVAPVTLRAKAIVQQLCREKLGWDDMIPQHCCTEWKRWLSSLPYLENVAIKRCYQPEHFGKITDTQLHVFSDGSETGYGACAYLRISDENGNVACSLVLGKSRLAPIKQMSIPRLELSGAVVASRLYEMVSKELELKTDQTIFWTDSTILLGYINNTSRRFKTFVGNRISIIHETTSPTQWRYVNSESNPADVASRGVNPCETEILGMWLNGPEFLLQSPDVWPVVPTIPDVGDSDKELKKNVMTLTTQTSVLEDMISRYSSWTKLQRAFAWLLRFKAFCKCRYLKRDLHIDSGYLKVKELREATTVILKSVQGTHFPGAISLLRDNKQVKLDCPLASLKPRLIGGLIKVTGRQMNVDPEKCLIILPRKHHVTRLIISHYHLTNGHVGVQQVLAATRERYWILHGPSTVKQTLRSCFTCRRQHSPLLSQEMGPILQEQATPNQPPFTFVGVDYFGPLLVKSGQTTDKRYGCLFTCLTTRAVHIEVAHSLTTDSFIAAFQRFTCRRGTPEMVHSDNATNFKGAYREMRKFVHELDCSKLNDYMVQKNVEWNFNPPYASHRGGAWERLIRSTRTILRAIVGEQLLTDEKLLTFMAEAERIMNDRPIVQVSNDPRDPSVLTPSMLLLMKTNASIPIGSFKTEETYSKRWWRQIQYLSDVFWKRWIREYLPMLQIRRKWQRAQTDLQDGDIVLVAQDNTPRGQWPLGRVTSVTKGRDGHVRSCKVRVRNTTYLKPISKLCLLESCVM